MKPSTIISSALITAMLVVGWMTSVMLHEDAATAIAVIHAESAKLMQLEETKRQDALINARLQLVVNQLNSNAPTEAERPSVWRQ